jgi:TatD DNase family protein
MIDTHVHIDHYPDPYRIALESENAKIVTIAVTCLPSHFKMALPHISKMKYIRLALGLHPLYAEKHQAEYEMFTEHINDTSYLGEIGLDFSREGINTKSIQMESFRYILERIKNSAKFITLHSRKAESNVLELLQEYNINCAVFHWYSGPIALIRKILDAGYYFSVNPAMMKSQNGLKIINRIPKERILTETDGPFIKVEGVPAKPIHIQNVINELAIFWGETIEKVEKQIWQNFTEIIKPLRKKRE